MMPVEIGHSVWDLRRTECSLLSNKQSVEEPAEKNVLPCQGSVLLDCLQMTALNGGLDEAPKMRPQIHLLKVTPTLLPFYPVSSASSTYYFKML